MKKESIPTDPWLRALIAPRSVALVGTSSSAAKLTARPLSFLKRHGFAGDVYPVHPSADRIQGHRAYPDVRSIPAPVEHAYVMLDGDAAIEAVRDCAEAGVRVVSVLADGFAEAGPEGEARQTRLAGIVRDAGMLLIGPNSTGVVGCHAAFSCTTNAAFAVDEMGAGHVAVLSQSGSLIGTVLSRGRARGMAFSNFVSVGNEAVTSVADVGMLMLDDPETHAFILFLETVRDAEALRRFGHACRAAGKPVVAYFIGQTDEGQALAVSHTGALTGNRAALSAFLKDAHIAQAQTLQTLIEAPAALATCKPRTARPRAATVVSTTGGGGAMVLDRISAGGVPIAGLSDVSRAKLQGRGIPLGHGKLVDVTLAGAKYETMRDVVATLSNDPHIGLLVIVVGSSSQFNPELAVQPIVDAVKANGADAAPVVAMPLPHAPESLQLLQQGGVPAFQSVESCAETVALLLAPSAVDEAAKPALPNAVRLALDAADSDVLDEVQAAGVFAALGIAGPRHVVLPPDETDPHQVGLRYPVVAKLVSRDLPHKSDAGAIELGLTNCETLSGAIMRMKSRAQRYKPGYDLAGILVQEVASGVGEVLLGLTRDPLVGPILTVGMGGIMTEIYQDVAVRPAPVSEAQARAMLEDVRGAALLRGFRGRPVGDLDALVVAISAFSALALDERVKEAEINPLLVAAEGEGVILLDAFLRIGGGDALQSNEEG